MNNLVWLDRTALSRPVHFRVCAFHRADVRVMDFNFLLHVSEVPIGFLVLHDLADESAQQFRRQFVDESAPLGFLSYTEADDTSLTLADKPEV